MPTRSRNGWRGAVAVAALALAVVIWCTSEERGDRQVIDRLLQLDVIRPLHAATTPSTTTHAGGGLDLIGLKNASFVTVVYESSLPPLEFGMAFHHEFDGRWDLHDNQNLGPNGWSSIGGDKTDPYTTADIEARPSASGAARSVVTVTVSATRE